MLVRKGMIDLKTEKLVPINQIRDRLPSAQKGKRVSLVSLYRWRKKGLETVKIGGTRYTSIEAVARFAEHGKKPSPPPPRLYRPVQSATADAARERIRKLIPGIN